MVYQSSGESPSDFLMRLNAVLQQVIIHGGIPGERANRSRLDKFLKGCLFHNKDILATLNLWHLKESPPLSHVDLLQMLRSEEYRRLERYCQRQQVTFKLENHQ